MLMSTCFKQTLHVFNNLLNCFRPFPNYKVIAVTLSLLGQKECLWTKQIMSLRVEKRGLVPT